MRSMAANIPAHEAHEVGFPHSAFPVLCAQYGAYDESDRTCRGRCQTCLLQAIMPSLDIMTKITEDGLLQRL